MGTPSQSTSERLAPEDPRPRSDTPCVVGWATRLEVRRKRLKPGTMRSRSSSSLPGVSLIVVLSMAVILAGVSAAMSPVTVMLVLTGSSFCCLSSGDWAVSGTRQVARTQQASAAPACLGKAIGRGAEDQVIAVLIERGFDCLSLLALHQSQILQNCIDIRFLGQAYRIVLGAKVDGSGAPRKTPAEKRAAIDGVLKPAGQLERNAPVQEN